MPIIIKVQSFDGNPCKGVRVTLLIKEAGNESLLTDEEGKAYFLYGPGQGTIYCDGQKVINERYISAIEVITYTQSGFLTRPGF